VAGGTPKIMECSLPDMNFFDCTIKGCTDKTNAACYINPAFTCPSGTEILFPDSGEEAKSPVGITNYQKTKTESRWSRFVKWLASF